MEAHNTISKLTICWIKCCKGTGHTSAAAEPPHQNGFVSPRPWLQRSIHVSEDVWMTYVVPCHRLQPLELHFHEKTFSEIPNQHWHFPWTTGNKSLAVCLATLAKRCHLLLAGSSLKDCWSTPELQPRQALCAVSSSSCSWFMYLAAKNKRKSLPACCWAVGSFILS